jgi:hypothetical protein
MKVKKKHTNSPRHVKRRVLGLRCSLYPFAVPFYILRRLRRTVPTRVSCLPFIVPVVVVVCRDVVHRSQLVPSK